MDTRTPSVLRTFALIFVAMAALFAADTFLAKAEDAARRSEARRLFQEGRWLEAHGRLPEAIDRLRTAVSNVRGDREYQLALAQALLAAGRVPEAESSLTDLLERDSTGGVPNLTMARLLVKSGRIPEAISYYHRAIYGQWKDDEAGNRVKARFELVDLLVRQDEKRALLAELLPLQDEAPSDTETHMRIGRLFLAAGAPSRAAEVFRSILHRQPEDADAYAGFGEAEFALGKYRAAQLDFAVASHLGPGDAQISAQLALCAQVLALDPVRRGIGPAEQRQRSRKLIELTLAEAQRCAGAAPPQPLVALMKKARNPGADVDANLDLAERLWQARRAECGAATSPADQALALVMAKLAQ
ncbi:MAG: tetratricopeptide repeat protein [Bryobacteraceae bacterium]|jgi:tetratricopeptide (TPR) repeat protein